MNDGGRGVSGAVPPVTLYWRPGCPFCARLRWSLRWRRVATTEVNIWRDPEAAAFVRSVAEGNETVPTVVVGTTFLVNPSAREVMREVERARARRGDDEGGITGHPDHRRATEAALAVARVLEVPVLAWALSDRVADTLRGEFGGGFRGRSTADLDYVVRLDRDRQRRAIARHVTQSTDNPVLGRRLELQGDEEAFRWLMAPSTVSRGYSLAGWEST